MRSPLIRFETVIEKQDFGTFSFAVIKLDRRLHKVLPLRDFPRLRVEAEFSGIVFKGSWQPSGGEWFLIVSRAKLKKAGLEIGSKLKVGFRIIPQDDVDIPEELARELEVDSAAGEAWKALSPGKKRSLAYGISTARTPKTRGVRLANVLAMLHGDKPMPWERTKRTESE